MNVALSMTTRTRDGSSSGYFLRSHFDPARLDTERIARESIRRAVEGRDARVVEPGDYPVILEPQAVADLLSSFAFSFDAEHTLVPGDTLTLRHRVYFAHGAWTPAEVGRFLAE